MNEQTLDAAEIVSHAGSQRAATGPQGVDLDTPVINMRAREEKAKWFPEGSIRSDCRAPGGRRSEPAAP
jgi:hypothetical protein